MAIRNMPSKLCTSIFLNVILGTLLPYSLSAQEGSLAVPITDLTIGIFPDQPTVSGSDTSDEAPPRTVRTSTQNWEFGFHGFFRAPLTLGFDTQKVDTYPLDENGVPDSNQPSSVSEDWQFHNAERLPDSRYNDWRYTNNVGGPFAELLFSYGNALAVGHVSIAAHNITDAGWRNLQNQLGIHQAFVTLNFPHAFRSRGGLVWNVGIFSNRYGAAGRYDAGRYDTYIFGKTHLAGETLTAQIALTDKLGLVLEHGFGAKSDVLPGNTKLDKDEFNRDPNYSWIPWGGYEGQLPAMVHHAHGGLVLHSSKLFKKLNIAGHFLHAFTNSADTTNNKSTWPYKDMDGKQIIGGAEIKTDGAIFGDVYLGFSTMKTDGLSKMPDAIEILHSPEGYSLLNNFYGDMVAEESETCGGTSRKECLNPGTGRINTLAWQYDLSLAKLLWYTVGESFFGQAPDVTISTWGMVNFVNPDDAVEPYLKRWAKRKMKVGAEAMYLPLPSLGFGLRFDRVIPDMDYNQADISYNETASFRSYTPFSVLSPKLTLKTAFLNREEVTLQYSRYFWDKSGLTETQYRNAVRNETSAQNTPSFVPADRNALTLSVTMWW